VPASTASSRSSRSVGLSPRHHTQPMPAYMLACERIICSNLSRTAPCPLTHPAHRLFPPYRSHLLSRIVSRMYRRETEVKDTLSHCLELTPGSRSLRGAALPQPGVLTAAGARLHDDGDDVRRGTRAGCIGWQLDREQRQQAHAHLEYQNAAHRLVDAVFGKLA